MNNKLKSFTLSEILVVIIITAILVGLAFAVLNLVKKQTIIIENNYSRTTELMQFKHSLWLDFNNYEIARYIPHERKLFLKSEIDSISYIFNDQNIIKNRDTLKLSLTIDKLFFKGIETKEGIIDGIRFTNNESPTNQSIFFFKKNDASQFINENGI